MSGTLAYKAGDTNGHRRVLQRRSVRNKSTRSTNAGRISCERRFRRGTYPGEEANNLQRLRV